MSEDIYPSLKKYLDEFKVAGELFYNTDTLRAAFVHMTTCNTNTSFVALRVDHRRKRKDVWRAFFEIVPTETNEDALIDQVYNHIRMLTHSIPLADAVSEAARGWLDAVILKKKPAPAKLPTFREYLINAINEQWVNCYTLYDDVCIRVILTVNSDGNLVIAATGTYDHNVPGYTYLSANKTLKSFTRLSLEKHCADVFFKVSIGSRYKHEALRTMRAALLTLDADLKCEGPVKPYR